jgi:hypothetical protein
MPDYYLVNPVIGGSLKTKFSGKNNLDAANKAYSAISEYFNNNIPEFYFTLQEVSSDKVQIGAGKVSDYKNFLVKETKKKNEVDYRIIEYKVTNNSKELKNFRAELKKLASKFQLGGKMKYDSDYDILDDDSSDYFPIVKRSTILSNPISFWFYDPYVFRIKRYYMPTYVAPLAPYVTVPLYLP